MRKTSLSRSRRRCVGVIEFHAYRCVRFARSFKFDPSRLSRAFFMKLGETFANRNITYIARGRVQSRRSTWNRRYDVERSSTAENRRFVALASSRAIVPSRDRHGRARTNEKKTNEEKEERHAG